MCFFQNVITMQFGFLSKSAHCVGNALTALPRGKVTYLKVNNFFGLICGFFTGLQVMLNNIL